MKDHKLPKWAKENDEGVIVVDPDLCYPEFLKAFQDPKPGDAPGRLVMKDQYWVECAFQCMKMTLQMIVGRPNIRIKVANRPEWALRNLPAGIGAHMAIGRVSAVLGAQVGLNRIGARAEFERLHGLIPKTGVVDDS